MGGLKGKANSELLRAAELAGYDVLLTVDQGIPQQQRAGGRKLAIILLRTRTNQMEDLLPSVDAIFEALQSIKPGQIVRIPDGCSPLGKALLWWARGLFS